MKTIDKILAAIDFSESSDNAFDYALTLAKQFNAELTILHVINKAADLHGFYDVEISLDGLDKAMEERATKMMQDFCKSHTGDFTNYKTVIANGVPYARIIGKALEIGASMIVIGTHGRTGLNRLIFGSTAARVVRAATCPVLSTHMPGK